MLGENQRQEPMFHYVRIEDMVPANHLLRLVDQIGGVRRGPLKDVMTGISAVYLFFIAALPITVRIFPNI